MNIKGLERLMEFKLPVMRNLYLFRELSEIPPEHMDIYQDESQWSMRGFNYERCKLSDHPHLVNEIRNIHGFSKGELEGVFEEVKNGLDNQCVPISSRKYFVCEVFKTKDVIFTGLSSRDSQNIYIDFFRGNRPSRKDWKPDARIRIPIIFGDKPTFSHAQIISSDIHIYEDSIRKISEDMMILSEDACTDFCKMKDGYLFYHDLCYVPQPIKAITPFSYNNCQ